MAHPHIYNVFWQLFHFIYCICIMAINPSSSMANAPFRPYYPHGANPHALRAEICVPLYLNGNPRHGSCYQLWDRFFYVNMKSAEQTENKFSTQILLWKSAIYKVKISGRNPRVFHMKQDLNEFSTVKPPEESLLLILVGVSQQGLWCHEQIGLFPLERQV